MMFMNEYEIKQDVQLFQAHPILGKAARVLDRFKDLVNANSDGWARWSGGPRAAKQLMVLLQNGRVATSGWIAHNEAKDKAAACVTEAAFTKALAPIRACCTRHGWAFPEVS